MTRFAPLAATDRAPAQRVAASRSSAAHAPRGLLVQRRAGCACGGGCPRCVQRAQASEASTSPTSVHDTAARGVRGAGAPLPHLERIQRSFGRHDVSGVAAHVGGEASEAARKIDATAYTMDGHVAFDGMPDVFTAAHEAAHVVQQRGGVQVPGGIGSSGDRFEQHADAVAAEVVAGRSAERLLDRHAQAGPPGAVVQRDDKKDQAKKEQDAKDAKTSAEITQTIDFGLSKIDEDLTKGVTAIRLAIRDDAAFERAWDDYCDRSGATGSRMQAGLNGFVDPTYPGGKMGFVRASKGVGTAIHEALHQRAHSSFYPGQAGTNVNEGTTEVFTRVVIAYAGKNIERNVYEQEKTAMLRFQGICGLKALAKWYFKGDVSDVQKSLGPKLAQFQDAMDGPAGGDIASRTQSAIAVL